MVLSVHSGLVDNKSSHLFRKNEEQGVFTD